MARFPIKLFKSAMGTRPQDILTIKNAWTSVTIRLEDGRYHADVPLCPRDGFPTLEAALEATFSELAAYEDGRCD